LQQNASTQCVSASKPVAAVTLGGMLSVSSGSRIATLGNSKGEKNTVFLPVSRSVATALRPTSLPVPAVVGNAIIGGSGPVIFALPLRASSYSASGPVCVAHSRTSLPMSSALPPPSATTRSALASTNALVAAAASSSVGLPATRSNTATDSPAFSSACCTPVIKPALATPGSVTISACLPPSFCASGPHSLTAPSPNTMRVG
jgi:hypothetical protein